MISASLQAMIDAEAGDRSVPVHILLEDGIDQPAAETLLDEVRRQAADPASVDYLRHMRIVLCNLPLGSVRNIDELSGIMTIDLDSEAPMANLLDFDG